jgi:heme exporter protein CcmD
MSHTPFILASYLISAVVLLWAAFAPVIQRRVLLGQLKNRQTRMDKTQ